MLQGLSIIDYLSIGERVKIGPLGKINLFVGPNNCGKSNILRFVSDNLCSLLTATRGSGGARLRSAQHIGRNGATQGWIGVAPSQEDLQRLFSRSAVMEDYVVKFCDKIKELGLLWIDSQWPDRELIEQATAWLTPKQWNRLYHNLTKQGASGDLQQHWIPGTLRLIRGLLPEEPSIYVIPINRQAGSDNEAEPAKGTPIVLSGRSIIRLLAKLQNPSHVTYDEDRTKFENIVDFVRIVTDDPSAKINVYDQKEISVQLKGQKFLPLAALGSGIEQVVLHAIAATAATSAVVTFEEPELHLHPVLQRQLMTYLAKTANQYFIATHSAHLIDAAEASTFHVRLVDKQTVVESADTDARRHRICHDLGFRASDIVQANCIIWVEGPSDRIYIRHWLKSADPHLRENVHYCVMFYGGVLLSHLSAGETDAAVVDEGLEDLIHLRWLNRHVAVVIDSDQEAEGAEIRETKSRVASEILKHGGIAWITAGREVENYVPTAVLRPAVEEVATGRGEAVKSGRYDKALPSASHGSAATVNKVEVAREVEKAQPDLTVLDLRDRLKELSAFIREANGLPALRDAPAV